MVSTIHRTCQCLQEFCSSSRNETKMLNNKSSLKETEKPTHSSGKIIVITKKEEQNHVAVKSSIAMWLCLKLPFIFELHETSLNVTKRKIVSTTLLLYIWDETEIHFSTAFYANMLLQLIINTIYVLGVIIIIYLHV